MQLRIPGPTPCPPQALEAMGQQMINHRAEDFARIIDSVTAKLKQAFQTKCDVFILTASGTGGMEAAIVNTLSPGDRVLSLSSGVFGDRFADIAERYGAEVSRVAAEWGKPVYPEAVRDALNADADIKAVLATHNETSTGVTNDLKSISAVVAEFDKLLLVDAISSLGCIDLPADDWHCDVVVTGSQKGWMVPPGLAMVSVSEKAWKAHAHARMPRFYWLILDEGLPNVFARHARVAQFTRSGIRSLGLSLFPEESCASNTVTAVNALDKLNVPKLVKLLREEQNVVIAGGQSKLSGRIFRIGHLGWVEEDDVKIVLEALAKTLPEARE